MSNRKICIRKYMFFIGLALNIITLWWVRQTNFDAMRMVLFCGSALAVMYAIWLPYTKIIKGLTVFISLVMMVAIGFNIYLYRYGRADNVQWQEDALIVLGARVVGDTPSVVLRGRLDAAEAYYRKNPKVVIVVSGAQGTGETVTEAVAMAHYLVAKGIPQEKILKEEKATTTCENIRYSKQLLDEYFGRDYNAVVVTNDFHIFRSVYIAKRMGMRISHLHANQTSTSVVANGVRETIAILFAVFWPCDGAVE